jgi:LuxR family maltose regulon positive regulatory protein
LLHFLVYHQACQVRVALCQGDLGRADRWARGDPEIGGHPVPKELPLYLREVQEIALARVYLAQNKFESVLKLFDRLYPQAKSAGRIVQLIELCLLKALALQAQGPSAAALEALQPGLSAAKPHGYVQLFLEFGRPVIPLLQAAASHQLHPTYIAKLLAAFEKLTIEETVPSKFKPDPSSSHALLDPLTPRELEVLHLICQGKSNQGIAQALIVSLSTVKKHTGNIYSKLGVSSRSQAIIRAQELELN